LKQYVVYLIATGQIKWFWVTPDASIAPDGMALLEVGSDVISSCVDTHKVVDGQLVLIE